jgi:hypothetical protein
LIQNIIPLSPVEKQYKIGENNAEKQGGKPVILQQTIHIPQNGKNEIMFEKGVVTKAYL